MQPNVNPETQIPFGVISAQSLDQDVFHGLLDNGLDRNVLQGTIYFVANSLQTLGIPVDPEFHKTADLELEELQELHDRALKQAEQYDVDLDSLNMDFIEPCVYGESQGVRYQIDQLGGAYLLTVLESPFMAMANKCSPCCPNAGDLDNLNEFGQECYDIHPSWRA